MQPRKGEVLSVSHAVLLSFAIPYEEEELQSTLSAKRRAPYGGVSILPGRELSFWGEVPICASSDK